MIAKKLKLSGQELIFFLVSFSAAEAKALAFLQDQEPPQQKC